MLSTRTNLDLINNSIAGVVARFTTPPFLNHGEKGARSVAANASGAFRYIWSDTLKPHTQGDIIKHRKGAADGTKIHGRI